MLFTAVHVHWALRAPLAKPTLTTAKTTTVRMEQPASMESTTTLAFVPPITQVSATQDNLGVTKTQIILLLYLGRKIFAVIFCLFFVLPNSNLL